MNLPNLITLARMFLTPVVVWLLIGGDYSAALLVFCVASASDALDGWLARVTQTQSELGAHLDPLADKMLLASAYLTLGIAKDVPSWLVIIVISRDILILGGLLLSWFMGKPHEVKPILISKANTLAQILFLIAVLLHLAFGVFADQAMMLGCLAVAGLTLASGLAYLWGWMRHMDVVA